MLLFYNAWRSAPNLKIHYCTVLYCILYCTTVLYCTCAQRFRSECCTVLKYCVLYTVRCWTVTFRIFAASPRRSRTQQPHSTNPETTLRNTSMELWFCELGLCICRGLSLYCTVSAKTCGLYCFRASGFGQAVPQNNAILTA